MNKLHVAVSPLTNRIYCGSVLKDGMTWAANKEDVTGEACAAVAQHAMAREGAVVVTANGEPKWEITVREAASALRAGAEPVDADGKCPLCDAPVTIRPDYRDGRGTEYEYAQPATPASGWMPSVDQVLGYIPVNIEGWKGVPEGYMPGYNDALGICRDSIRLAFAECRTLPTPPASKGGE